MSNPYKTIYELRETIAELSERCREQEADIEELLKEREWVSVKDRLPECNKDVLIYAVSKSGNSDAVICITERKDYIWFGHEIPMQPYWKDPWQYFHSNYDITHWMPLPQKPESEDDAK